MKTLRAAAVAGLLLASLSAGEAGARPRDFGGWLWNYYDYPWCIYTMNDFNECTFETLAQCNATRAGVGGTCYRNPRLADGDRRSPRLRPPRQPRS
jgi:hypothetical protein